MAATPHIITFANEKGGSGKSTSAVHVAIALAVGGRRVAALDLDPRQRTMTRYLENRVATTKRIGVSLATPRFETIGSDSAAEFEDRIAGLSEGTDVILIDTPGRDDPLARLAATRADTLVTPINDSFIDLDLIGQVDPETYRIKRPSFYAELIWDARKVRAKADGATVDWVVLRNRLQQLAARNMHRVGAALDELSKRIGYRVIPGLSERVIYRELFPKGLTLLDVSHLEGVGISHIAARQELREMVAGLALPDWPTSRPATAEAETPEPSLL
ncbi:MAG TPA: division plane positioning ATPase MipZ [Sphingomonadaceae bacterium]|nr:division plane positioning ATPase MipZ [Sphingomonadaceae bacterium]